MKSIAFIVSCLLIGASVPLSHVKASKLELALEYRNLFVGDNRRVSTRDDFLVRHLEEMSEVSDDEERARALFDVYKVSHPASLATLGSSEEDQFKVFFNSVYPRVVNKFESSKIADGGSQKVTSETVNFNATSDIDAQGSEALAEILLNYAIVSATDPTEITDGLSFYTQIYNDTLAASVDALQDNTNNIEAIVQSTKPSEENQPGNEFQGPTVLEGEDEGPTSLNGRRLEDSNSTTPPVQVLFCDVGGNAIWRWSHTPYYPDVPINKTTTVSTSTPTKLCESPSVEVKVTAYQSGCSRQNHPEGCDNVYYKGCGGLTVNRAANRVVVARTGGRSLGLLYYKQAANTCQGRVVDAITHYKGKRLNSPSDAEYTTNGDLYFSDSPFGLATSEADFEGDILDKSPLKELPFNGVFKLANGSSTLDLVDCTMDRPNKIAFSPKNDYMYVTNARKGNSYVKRFTLNENGTVSNSAIFFNFTQHPELETAEGYADGIKVDSKGRVYVAVYKGIYIFSPRGELIGTLKSNQVLNGVALGGGRLFVSGSFGLVAQANSGLTDISLPKAKTDC